MTTEDTNTQVVETPSTVVTPDTTQTPSEPQYTEVELRALEQGWKPKDQWDGNPDEHRSAREFLDRGELLGKLKLVTSETKNLREQIKFLSDHQRKVHQAAYEQAVNDLKAQKAEALQREDFNAVVEIDDAIAQNREAISALKRAPAAPPETVDMSPVFDDWLQRNSWYKRDNSKKIWADAMAVSFASAKSKQGVQFTEKELYDHLETEARKIFSDEYKTRPTTTTAAPPSPDGTGRRGSGTAKVTPASTPEAKLKALISEFPEKDRRIVERMVQDGVVTAEQFVKDFELVKDKG